MRLESLELASKAIRKHWHIENQQRWALDVIFKEDEQRIYEGDSALNMACCRRFVQNCLESPQEAYPRFRTTFKIYFRSI